MADAQGSRDGRFVWHDLNTKDAAKAQAFYSGLFGWQIVEVPAEGYTYRMIMAGPGPIGGIIEEARIPVAHWMPYCAVDDVDAAAAKAKQLGGSVRVPPADIPDTGRFSVVVDPQGGALSLFKGLPESQGFDPDLTVPGRVCWNELLTTDDVAAQKFYTPLFGWADRPKDVGPMGTYHVQMLGDKEAGGIMKTPQPDIPTCWTVYFRVDDLSASTAKAKSLGATAMMENTQIEDVGSFSMLTDPTGALFSLMQLLDTANC